MTLTNNIFFHNQAVDDLAVYNCGSYGTVENNWWGSDNPNFDDGYLVEWHRIGSNDKRKDSNPLKITFTSDKDLTFPQNDVVLAFKFVNPDGSDFTGKMAKWDVKFTSTKEGDFESKNIVDNRASAAYTPKESGEHIITAQMDSFKLDLKINVKGEFEYLQSLVNSAEDVLELTRDFTYSSGDNPSDGIRIAKPIVINGNGHIINGISLARIFSIHSSEVIISNVTFVNGNFNEGGAIFIDGANGITISNSKFLNNYAYAAGGAIYAQNGDGINIIDCYFENNGNYDYGGGALYISTPNALIKNSKFINNTASQGGAIDMRNDNLTIESCEFIGNVVSDRVFGGGAINVFGKNIIISNSVFLNNKANVEDIEVEITENGLAFTFVGYENYINAIHSSYSITFSNVTYWSGEVTTSNEPLYSSNESGQNITLEIYEGSRMVKKVILQTDLNGQAKFDFREIDNGNYTYKAYHVDDDYYFGFYDDVSGKFTVNRSAPHPSSVNISKDKNEFEYGKINIGFTAENATCLNVVVTNYNASTVYYDYIVEGNKIFERELPVSDEYYNITVYNLGNDTVEPSRDSMLFKVIKATPHIQITELNKVIAYADNVIIRFAGERDCHYCNVTIYDKNNELVHDEVVFVAQTVGSMKIPVLPIGEYNITVTNLGNGNKKAASVSDKFTVIKTNNNIKVMVADGVYGENTTVTVNADIDGQYLVKINSTDLTVNVLNGMGTKSIELGAGYYVANVSFDNENCINNATNNTFMIQKAQSDVYISIVENVIEDEEVIVELMDDYPATYNVVIYDSNNEVKLNKNITSTEFALPSLELGQYNMTVTNLGNENITESSDSVLFDVTRDNYVEVNVENADFGRELLIYILADVDGNYTVNINGTIVPIEVMDGFGFYYDYIGLDAGEYSTNVTFDNPKYENIITNANFTIYGVESNLQIYDIAKVLEGEDVVVRFYDDYPTVFYIEVQFINGTTVFNTTFLYDDKNPEMSVILSGLDAEQYQVYIENLGDENIAPSDDYILFNVTEVPGTIVASDMTRGYNSGMDFNATLVDRNGTGISNTAVTFVINGKSYVAVTDANGVAVINPKMNVGNYAVEVINPYNSVKTTKTLKVVTRISGNRNVETYYGKNYQYKLRIIGDDGNPVGLNVAVNVKVNGKAMTLKTDKNGYIAVKFTKNYLPKTYTVIVEYKGIKVSNKIKVNNVLKLKKVKVKRSAKKLTLKATLKEGKKALKGKKLVFKFKGKKYTAKTNKKGVAKVTIKKKVLKKLKKGKKLTYQVTYLKSTVKRTAKVLR